MIERGLNVPDVRLVCAEWQEVSQACAAYSLILTSLYDTLGREAVQFIIGHAEVSVVFSAPNHIPALLKLAKHCPTLKLIVSIESWDSYGAQGQLPTVKGEAVLKEWAEQAGVKLMDLAEGESHVLACAARYRLWR